MTFARGLIVCGLLLGAAGVTGAAEAGVGAAAFAEDFATAERWKARPGITLEASGPTESDRKHMHVRGRQEKGWNYVTAVPFEMRPGAKYRLSAWVLVQRGNQAYPPYLKVEFVAKDTNGRADHSKALGRVASCAYDPIRGGWQELTGEFECPPEAGGGWIALEKGVDAPLEIDAELAQVRVFEIDRFTPATYRFSLVPPELAAAKDIHPRLYLTRQRFEQLKAQVQQEPYRAMLAKVLRVADFGVRNGPPKYTLHDAQSGDEQLWQREVGNMMPHLAMAYRLTGQAKYLETAKAFIAASAAYPTWGLGSAEGKDLAAGHQLYGMALAYDWLYDDLDPATRQTAEQCLTIRGRFMFEQAIAGKAWWHRSYLQNHQWVNLTGLAAAGLALYGHVPGTEDWAHLALDKIRIALASLGTDGASHEGVPYWSYGVEYLLKFTDLAQTLLGEDMLRDNAWFKQTASFRLYSMLPRNAWRKGSSLMTFADGPRADWYGPDYLLRRLAAKYRNGHAQWLAQELDQANLCGSEASFLNLLWFDPSVPAAGPARLPTARHFEDLGLVYLRSGWSGDESALVLKCGPALGHEATQRFTYDPGAGHVHPDAGSLLLFAHGDWLLVPAGYAFKRTAYQNTMTINDAGQAGEGKAWFDAAHQTRSKRAPSILRARFGQPFDLVTADVTQAYPADTGLTLFLRHVVRLGPDTYLLVDELRARQPAEFCLYFHGDFPFGRLSPGTYAQRGPNGSLRLSFLWPQQVTAQTSQQSIKGAHGETERKLELLQLLNPDKSSSVVFVTLLETHASAEEPTTEASVVPTDAGLILTLRSPAGERRLLLDLSRTDPAAEPVKPAP